MPGGLNHGVAAPVLETVVCRHADAGDARVSDARDLARADESSQLDSVKHFHILHIIVDFVGAYIRGVFPGWWPSLGGTLKKHIANPLAPREACQGYALKRATAGELSLGTPLRP